MTWSDILALIYIKYVVNLIAPLNISPMYSYTTLEQEQPLQMHTAGLNHTHNAGQIVKELRSVFIPMGVEEQYNVIVS